MNRRNYVLLIVIIVLTLYFCVDVNAALLSLPFLLLTTFFLFFILRKKQPPLEQLPTLSKKKEEHYKNIGMTPDETAFFRNTMNIAKVQITQLQENMTTSAKLRAIDLRNDTVKLAKALFKELVKEPKKLHFANHFLYTHLPNLVELTNKYLEINSHEIKNKQTYEKLEETAQIIDQVSKLISIDYLQLISDDLDDLDVEISIAKSSLNKDNICKEKN